MLERLRGEEALRLTFDNGVSLSESMFAHKVPG